MADATPVGVHAPPPPLLSAQLYREMAASGLGGAPSPDAHPLLARVTPATLPARAAPARECGSRAALRRAARRVARAGCSASAEREPAGSRQRGCCVLAGGGLRSRSRSRCVHRCGRHGRRWLHIPRLHGEEPHAGAPGAARAVYATHTLWSLTHTHAAAALRHCRRRARRAPAATPTLARLTRWPPSCARRVTQQPRPRCIGSTQALTQHTLHACTHTHAQEGWRTLFKGFSTVLPVAPAQALYMGGYQGFRRLQPGDPDSAAVQFGARATSCVHFNVCCCPSRPALTLRAQWAAWWRR
jgi:hypothetical protein